MTDDPAPHFRCRCVHRTVHITTALAHLLSPADPYYDRCPNRPTAEDGICDHCRPDACSVCPPDRLACCLHPTQRRTLVDLTTPCAKVPVVTENPVPF